MKNIFIYNLKSLFIKKNKLKINIKYNFSSQEKKIKINNCIYDCDVQKYKLIPFVCKTIKLRTENKNHYTNNIFLIKHSVLPYYSSEYKIKNSYLLSNIEEFYRITKVYLIMFNQELSKKYESEININHDVIFTILKFHENKLLNIEEYKKKKFNEIINEEVYNIIIKM